MENMMSMVLQLLDAISAQQREAAARVDRLEMGVLSLLPARAAEGRGLEAGGVQGGVGQPAPLPQEEEGDTTSPSPSDQGYDYTEWPESKGPPFGDKLVAKENAERVDYSKPDMVTEEAAGRVESEGEERKVAYCARMILWLLTQGARNRPLWFPAATYQKQEHDMTFTVGLQPHRPVQVHDLRGWVPGSMRGQGTVHRAVARLLAAGKMSQVTWGRGVVLYCGQAPRLR